MFIVFSHIQEYELGTSYIEMSHTSFQYWTTNIWLISKNMREVG